MGQRSNSNVQLTSEADMRVQMTLFGQSDGRQMIIFALGWTPIELSIPKSTRSSANSSRIKSYDCLKLTLIFQSRNDFIDFIQDQKRILDRIKTISNACKADARVHSNQVHASNHARTSR